MNAGLATPPGAAHLRRLAFCLATGAMLGAILIGGGGRLAMRILALLKGGEPVFSLGGTLDILLYGALLGAAGGMAAGFAGRQLKSRPLLGGLLLGLALYGGAILTLPGHIAGTAAPFADMMTAVWLLFGLCFLAWGVAMGRLAAAKA